MSNYFNLQNNPVLTTPSAVTVPKIDSIGYPGDDTAADPAGGQTITLTGTGFEAGAAVLINTTAVGVVTVVNSTTITFTSPANSAGSYVLYVVNTDGGTAIAVPGIQYSGTPTWTTAAGSLGSYTETQAIANTVTATGDAPITYSLFSGTLPTGATLNSANGYISGTSPLTASPTTYTFTIRATDAQQQDTNRSFSLTINPDVVTWSSPANNTTYTNFVDAAISNVALSASAASGQSITYTANALPTGLSISGSNITGTPTVVANSSSLLTATANTTNATATRTINWVISVAGDTYFPYVTSLLSASTPTSTFVTDASTNAFAVTVNGDTRPSNFGPYTPGYYSNFFDGNGDSLSYTGGSSLNFSTGDFTIETWAYLTNTGTFSAFLRPDDTGAFPEWGYDFSSGQLKFDARSGAIVSTTTTMPTNQWVHLAVSRSGTSLRQFINGTQVGSTTTNSTNFGSTTGLIRIGGSSFSASHSVNGYLSNFRVVVGTAVYTSNFTPATAPFTAIANTSLLTCQSNRFIDNSTNNFTITRNGDTLISGFDPFVPSTSYADYGSTYFDGTGDYLDVINSSTCSNFGTSDFTVEGWFYLQSSASQILYDFRTGSSDAAGALYYSGTNINWYVSGADRITGSALALNQWYHIAVARSGTSTKLFVNGTQVGSTYTDTTNYIGNTNRPRMGFLGDGTGTLPYTGYMSNLRVVKGTAVYTTTFTPPTTPLTAVANTSLLTCQSNQPNNNNMFLDGSTFNYNITRNGNTTQGSFSPYGGGWSNFFIRSSSQYLTVSNSNSQFSFGTGAFTIECFVNLSSLPSSTGYPASYWLFGGGAVNSNPGIDFYINNTQIGFNLADFTSATAIGNHSMSVGVWYHVAVIRGGGSNQTVSIYVNGVRVATASNVTATADAATTGIAISAAEPSGATGGNFDGYISNYRVVKGTAVYDPTQSTLTVPTAPLTPIAGTSLMTCADNRFIDDSGNNLTITRSGSPTIQRFNPFNPVVTTPTSYSGYFDGTGDYLNLTGSGLGSGAFTIEMWVYMTSYPNAQNAIYSNGTGDNVNASTAVVYINSSGTLSIYNYPNSITTSGTIALNQWNHVAVVRSGGTITLYINGTSSGSGANTNNISDTAVQIMRGYGGITNSPIGYVSNVRVVVGTAVYTSNFTPSTSPLTAVANTSLLTLQNATFIDNSNNNFAITANGDVAPRQFNPFGWTSTTGGSAAYTTALYGGSAYFDGNGDYLSTSSSVSPVANEDFTIECWYYPISKTLAYPTIYANYTTYSSSAIAIWDRHDSWPTKFVVQCGSVTAVSTTTVTNNTWYHIVTTRTSGTLRLYINGVLEATTSSANSSNNPDTSRIGAGDNASLSVSYINGYVSDFRITRGTTVYTSNFAPPVAPLTARQNTVFLANMTNAGIVDSSMMITYETVGASQINTSIKKYGSVSYYIPGGGANFYTPANPNLDMGTGNFTIECWVYNVSIAANYPSFISSVTGWSAGASGHRFNNLGAANKFTFHLNGAGDPFLTSTNTFSFNTWYHYALTRSGNTWRMFINGNQEASGTYSSAFNQGLGGIKLGYATWDGANGYYNGYLDDLRFTKGVARYTSNFTPTTTPFLRN